MFKRLTKILGGGAERRQLEKYAAIADAINRLEPQYQAYSDDQLRAKTDEFRQRLANGETPEDLIPEAFATVRETAIRTIGMRHFDVQLVGGVVLHEGIIAEMKTGEGKTLVATLPIYLNALTGRGVHLVTVNDYLARRDARWMGPIYDFLGLTVGVLQEAARTENGRKAFLYDPSHESIKEDVHQLKLVDRKLAYAADITYGTNNEFGFDYLRSNMARSLDARVQREHHYVILDEVDNILIDEARTPLIISGPAKDDPQMYVQMASVIKQLRAEDYEIDERSRTVSLTEIGEDHVERIMGIPLRDPDRPEDITPQQARTLGHVEQALRAAHLFKRNKDYVVQGGRVIIVDEFTGRMMAGRRWADGLHQAVEAKEGVRVRQENVTYATITLQNYFRMYEKLAGMTGTAVTEAEEFFKIYNVEVMALPTNLEFISMKEDSDLVEVEYRENGNKFAYFARSDDPDEEPVFWRRKDYPDVVFRTEEAKFRAATTEILARHVQGQPLLIGTTSVELSEHLSSRLSADPLQRLASILILRDAYLEAHGLADDGMRVDALEMLYEPLEGLKAGEMRPMARELGISLNPTTDENLDRLAKILDLEPEDKDRLAEVLKAGIRHNVLNAKKHDEESRIIADAGALGAVTIATNMAGRGVDIKLGGEIAEEVLAAVNRVLRRVGIQDPENLSIEERVDKLEDATSEAIGIYDSEVELARNFMAASKRVREVGGLHVIGSERHDARRIDNQLRGRSGRQGDPGSSQFFLSLGDELMRLFGGEQVSNLMQRLNIDDAVPIAHNIVNRTIEQAQTRVEGANFDTRKHLLEYDDVLNQQREIFYGQRDRVLTKDDLQDDIGEMLELEVQRHVETALSMPESLWKLLAWLEETQPTLNIESQEPYPSFMLKLLLGELEGIVAPEEVRPALLKQAMAALDAQFEHIGAAVAEQFERTIERLDQQVQQRVELAEMAIEGAELEADETGTDVDPGALVQALEKAAGVRIQIEAEDAASMAADPRGMHRMLPALIEGALGLRVWAGLVQTLESRVGESLGLELSLRQPVDWDEAYERLQNALEEAWSARRERFETEIEGELEAALSKVDVVDEALKIRLMVGMSYGTQAYFDRKTHQRRARRVARLSYAYSAADLIEGLEEEELVGQVIQHLFEAQEVLKSLIGHSESTRVGRSSIAELEDWLQTGLRQSLGNEGFDEVASMGSIDTLPAPVQERLRAALGHVILTEAHRRMFLSVADSRWVEYLTMMEALRTSIGLEAYGQRDPLVQYKSRAFDLFQQLLSDIRSGFVSFMFRVQSTPRAQAESATGERQPATRAVPAGSASKPKGKKKRRRRRR